MTEAPSPRTKVRRGAERADYEHDTINAILDSAMIAHVGVQTADGPLVLPMAFGRDDTNLYLHGALANHLIASGTGQQICVTVSHVDGLVMARTPFHNSMNYRSVVIRGEAARIEEPSEQLRALKIITDHVVTNWDLGRPVSEKDRKLTRVISVPLAEASAKIRSGDPIDDEEDMAGPWWAGVIPVSTVLGEPRTAADYSGDRPVPDSFTAHPG